MAAPTSIPYFQPTSTAGGKRPRGRRLASKQTLQATMAEEFDADASTEEPGDDEDGEEGGSSIRSLHHLMSPGHHSQQHMSDRRQPQLQQQQQPQHSSQQSAGQQLRSQRQHLGSHVRCSQEASQADRYASLDMSAVSEAAGSGSTADSENRTRRRLAADKTGQQQQQQGLQNKRQGRIRRKRRRRRQEAELRQGWCIHNNHAMMSQCQPVFMCWAHLCHACMPQQAMCRMP
jgi:hypothetical protein